jgi:hypothetical protein
MIEVIREAKRTPAEVEERLARAGGLNLYGRPVFRVVWGWSRPTWIGGKWTDRDEHGNVIREVTEMREVPKYLPFDRWHLERWLPAELYGGPQQWYENTIERADGLAIPALGPYPHEGEYELCVTLEGPRGEFVPLEVSAVEWLVRAIQYSRGLPAGLRRGAIAGREEKKDRDFEKYAYDVLDDAAPALHGVPFVTVPEGGRIRAWTNSEIT